MKPSATHRPTAIDDVLNLRLPRDLRERLERRAAIEGNRISSTARRLLALALLTEDERRNG